MKYVDVILPLRLEGVLTYAVPESMQLRITRGMRVVVPLGKSKTYTGIVANEHVEKPDFELKSILDLPDHAPVVSDIQLKLWQWMASYYMTSLGEVYTAALPAGLKTEDGYTPRTETYVTLAERYRSETSLALLHSMLLRANSQQKMLACYLALSHWDTLQGDKTADPVADITREELMNVSRGTAATFRNLTSRGILQTYEQEVGRLNDVGAAPKGNIKPLSVPQQEAYNQVLMQWMKRDVVLLHGVTGSGKTEIYIHLIQHFLAQKQQVLYLVPEIALTVQLTMRLQKVFGNRLGVYHSKYSDAERVEIWQKQLSEHPYEVILGARSAVFLPFQRLGVVIVDEEHETSFKQQDPAPRYHARSAAVVLAGMFGAKTLLGTATPSVESYHNAAIGKYGKVELRTRFKEMALPKMELVDVKDLRRRKIMRDVFSSNLIKAVQGALDEGKQAILFQNRRGFAPMITCGHCGWVPKCKNCDVSLTLHRNMNQLTCHYCGFTYQMPVECPECGGHDLRDRGYGTEKIEEMVRGAFPKARIARMDLDTTRTRNAYERIINDFSAGKTNLLIGTQMVSKGLDFDNVKVVGIIDADTLLNYPDFRSYEYAFSMISQVSGRAGRKGERGRVILQTKNADLPVIQQIAAGDDAAFYRDVLQERAAFRYPPYSRLIYVYIKHRYEDVADGAASALGWRLRAWFGERVLGPDKPAVARVQTLHIRKLVMKLEKGLNGAEVRRYLHLAQQELLADKHYAAVQIYFDVDPM